jgi:hypothetical protein
MAIVLLGLVVLLPLVLPESGVAPGSGLAPGPDLAPPEAPSSRPDPEPVAAEPPERAGGETVVAVTVGSGVEPRRLVVLRREPEAEGRLERRSPEIVSDPPAAR